MNILSISSVSALFATISLLAAAPRPEPRIVERGPHHRRWVHVSTVTLPDGRTVEKTNSYVELGMGLHYLKDGEWIESREVIDIVPGGAMASQGAHQVGFAANANTAGAINMLTADSKRLRSHVLGLAYTSAKTGQTIWIARIKDSTGELVGKNQIFYRDAFDDGGNGTKADLRYTYTREGLEQDVIFRPGGSPPPPEAYGLDAAYVRLEVVTEFIETPEPQIEEIKQSSPSESDQKAALAMPHFTDRSLNFGTMRMEAGEAFAISPDGARQDPVPTGKLWHREEGRTFLIEAVDYPAVKSRLEALEPNPGGKRQALIDPQPGVGRSFPTAPKQAKADAPMKTAALSRDQSGFVIDYIITTGVTNFTFAADTTYYVGSSTFLLYGTTVFEGGTVVKYTNGLSSPQMRIVNGIDCRTSPYRPAIFTSMHDNSVGDTIANSTGNPTNYCGYMIYLGNSSSAGGYYNLHDLHVSHAARAFYGTLKVSADISNCQVVHSQYGFKNNTAFWNLRNILVHNVQYAFDGATPLTNNVEHATFHSVSNFLFYAYSLPPVNLTNSLLIGVTNLVSYVGANVQTNLSETGIFQTVGSASHYLPTNSPYLAAGTTNINSGLLADLKQRTTFPPQVYSNAVVSADLTMTSSVARDTNANPTLGYHYDVLDYLVTGLTVSNAAVNITNGAAVGVDYSSGSWGFILKNAKVISQGDPLNLNRIVRAHMVQERSSGNPVTRALFYDGLSHTSSNELRLRFTAFSQLVNDGSMLSSGSNFSALEWSHSAIYNPQLKVDTAGGNLISCGLTNTLWERGLGQFGLTSSSGNSVVHARNNLFRNFSQHFYGAQSSWSANDNLVDTAGLDNHGVTLANANNAYYKATTNLSGGSGNLTITNLSYQGGPLGNYYQPAGSVLVDAGSQTAANASLYHFTTGTNQTKEGSSTVDIGLHYAALDGNGRPVDGDWDGLPDYIEDANGNGIKNSNETDITLADTDYDGRSDLQEIADGTNPLDASSVIPVLLAHFQFNATNFMGEQGQLPTVYSNILNVPSWNGKAASLFCGVPAMLSYRDTESSGAANVNCRNGTVSFWFKPAWRSATFGGSGPGHEGKLLEIGSDSTNGTYGQWAVCINSDGTVLQLCSQAQGVKQTNLNVAIEWPQAQWRHVIVAYTPSNSALYVDGQLKASGSGVQYYPSASVRAQDGLRIGMNRDGNGQGDGDLDSLKTHNFPLSPQQAADAFAAESPLVAAGACDCPLLRPIALPKTLVDTLVINSQFTLNSGGSPGSGNFGWLDWDWPTTAHGNNNDDLEYSIKFPDSCTYINRCSASPTTIIGNPVHGNNGNGNSAVKQALENLIGQTFPVPVWQTYGNINPCPNYPSEPFYTISHVVRIELVGVDNQLNITAKYKGAACTPNLPPGISPIDPVTTPEDTPVIVYFHISDDLTPIASLNVSAVSSDTMLFPAGNMVIAPDTRPGAVPGDMQITLSPAANLNGGAQITLTVTDGAGASTTRSFLVSVTPVNDPPTISGINNQTINEDTSSGTINFTVGDIDNNVSSLTVSATSSKPGLVPQDSIHITFGGSGANRTVTITPAPNQNSVNQNGPTIITVTVNDGQPQNNTASTAFNVTVTPVPDAPVIDFIPAHTDPDDLYYTENALPQPLAPSATVSDVDTADFNGGFLWVYVGWDYIPQESLTILNQNNITLSGEVLSYEGIPIGVAYLGGNEIYVNFDHATSLAAVQALVKSIGYHYDSENPPAITRDMDWVLGDSDGAYSEYLPVLHITPVDDLPVVVALPSSIPYLERQGPTAVSPLGTVQDVDTSDFESGAFLAWVPNPGSGDTLSLQNEGTGSGQIGISGETVSYSGQPIGPIIVLSSTEFFVLFEHPTSLAAVQALLRNVSFRNDSQNPASGNRTVLFEVYGPGQVVPGTDDATINVIPVNNLPEITVNGLPLELSVKGSIPLTSWAGQNAPASSFVALAGGMGCVVDDTTLKIVSYADPANPTVVGTWSDGNSIAAVKISPNDHIAYVFGSSNLRILDISNPQQPTVLNGQGTDLGIFAISDVVSASEGKKFYISWIYGIAGVDVSTPAAPVSLGNYVMGGSGYGVAVSPNNDRAYLADNGYGLVAFGLANGHLTAPVGTWNYPASKVVLSANGNVAYVMRPNSSLLYVVSVEDVNEMSQITTVDLQHPLTDLQVNKSRLFVADNNDRFHVLDISNPVQPILKATLAVGQIGHLAVAPEDSTAFVSVNGALKVVDIGTYRLNLPQDSALQPVALYINDAETTATCPQPPANCLTLTSDSSNPAYVPNQAQNISFVGNGNVRTVTVTPVSSVGGSSIVALTVHDNDGGLATKRINVVNSLNEPPNLFVKDLTPDVSLLGTFRGDGLTGVCRGPSADRVYVSATSGFYVVDISNPYSPRVEGFIGGFSASAAAISADGNTAFVAVGSAGLKIIDLSIPANPSILSTLGIGYASMLAISPDRNTLYVAGSFAGCRMLDVSSPHTPVSLGQVGGGYISSAIALSADGQKLAFVELAKVTVVDLSTPVSPTTLMLYWFDEGQQGNGALFMGGGTSVHVSVGNQTLVLDWSGAEPAILATLNGTFSGSFTRDGTKLLGSSLYDIGNALAPVRINDFKGFGNGSFSGLSMDETRAFTFTSDTLSVWDIGSHYLKIRKNQASPAIGLRVTDLETPAELLTLNAAASNPTLLPPGAFTFGGAGADRTLTITPVTGQQGAATVTVTVQDTGTPPLTASKKILINVTENEAPIVTASYDQAVEIPQTATLGATASDDGFPNGALSFSWSKVSGPGDVGFSAGNALNTAASFSVPGYYVVRFTASDSQLSAGANVLITVVENEAPVVNAGPDRKILTGGSANLSGTVSDDGRPLFGPIYQGQPSARSLRIRWTSNIEGVVFEDDSSAATTATFPGAGTYRLTLTATEVFIDESEALSGSDEVVVTVGDDFSKVYTYNVDFQKGALHNVNFDDVPNELRLNNTTAPYPYVYFAASRRGTIVRVDARTGQILGEYATAPNNHVAAAWPSRISVDSKGNVWVANSGVWSNPTVTDHKGSITRIGVVIGGTRGRKDGATFVPDPTGDYLAPPFIYNTCVDRDGDGFIRTSRGRGHIFSWPNTGNADEAGGVTTAQDEAIINYVRVRPNATGE